MRGGCGYYKRRREFFLYCELVRVKFPSKALRNDWYRRFCSIKAGSAECPIKKALDEYYDAEIKLNDV